MAKTNLIRSHLTSQVWILGEYRAVSSSCKNEPKSPWKEPALKGGWRKTILEVQLNHHPLVLDIILQPWNLVRDALLRIQMADKSFH